MKLFRRNHNSTKPDEQKTQESENSFLGIKFSDNNIDNNTNNLFGIPTTSSTESVNFATTQNSENISPAVRDLINRLEVAVRSNKIDNDAINLYRQITQLSNIDNITKNSAILNNATLSIFRDKEKELINQDNSSQINNPQFNQSSNFNPNNAKIIDDLELRKMQAEFLDSRQPYQKSLEEQGKEKVLETLQNNTHNNVGNSV